MQRKRSRLDIAGLGAAGLWVRRQAELPHLADEALGLSELVRTWQLKEHMSFDHVGSAYAEVSSPDLAPIWVFLIELTGQRLEAAAVLASHPLSQVEPGTDVRLLALVQPPALWIPGVLVETPAARRMLWLRPSPG